MPETGRRDATLYRAYVPRWAHDPLSGAGAARFGGRWNRVGQKALYAAFEQSTAWAEYNQSFVQHPALIAALRLEAAKLADLTTPEGLAAHFAGPRLHETEWRADLDAGRLPETHRLAARLIHAGFDGAIYPSFMSPGGACAVLWRWNEAQGATLAAIDPEGRLPRSPASWL